MNREKEHNFNFSEVTVEAANEELGQFDVYVPCDLLVDSIHECQLECYIKHLSAIMRLYQPPGGRNLPISD